MDFLADNLWVLWLIIAAVMLLIEISTAALVSVWFVFGAVATAIVASFWDSFIGQVIFFLALSGVFLVLFRKLYQKRLERHQESEGLNYSLAGRTATAAEDITQYDGKVLIGDVYWKATCAAGTEIPKGSVVTVTEESGTMLKVERKV